ncbi:MAG: hypothetical protein ACI4OJ_08945 [Lachnospiraceae bacterium]
MFKQYRKVNSPFHAQTLVSDGFVRIVYPSREHATFVSGQDFYVMGSFAESVPAEGASLQVFLLDAEGTVLREVGTKRQNDFAHIRTDVPGIETQALPDEIRVSGMPDLVFAEGEPLSQAYTWNKAFFTEHAFAALVYGGASCKDTVCGTDQRGQKLNPLPEGIYRIRAELKTPDAVHVTEQTLRIAGHTKEIVISRYISEAHLRNVERFAAQNGFETYTDPCAGNWFPESFPFPWPGHAAVEIPARWHFEDALEYRHDIVHCFDCLLSESCVGYEVEIGTVLHENPQNADAPERCHFYYYTAGDPESGDIRKDPFSEFAKGQFFAVTGIGAEGPNPVELFVRSVCKPIPSATMPISDCRYRILNRIANLRYAILDQEGLVLHEEVHAVGRPYCLTDGKMEQLLLESEHRILVPEDAWRGGCQLLIEAADLAGKVWDHITLPLPGRLCEPHGAFSVSLQSSPGSC